MKTLAIIGLGPRGLFVLENVLEQLSKSNKSIKILIFEPFKDLGSGPVWKLDQPDSNWINISERALKDFQGRPEINYLNFKIPSFPSYHDWSNFAQTQIEPDTFPPRHKIGRYLNERFLSLNSVLTSCSNFKIISANVNKLEHENRKLTLVTNDNSYDCDEAVITVGHQPTAFSKQLKSWIKHAESSKTLQVFSDAYPVSQFDNLKNKTNITIGLRGFGLAMIDVARALTINNFGNFKTTNPSTFECQYYKSKPQHLKLVPFSLDGLPLVPKPLNEQIDLWFKPTEDEIQYLKSEIKPYSQGNVKAHSTDFLIDPATKIIARIYEDLGSKAIDHDLNRNQLQKVASQWLKDQDFEHALIQDTTITTYDLTKAYIRMALGEDPISLDFCIGQVWRHCQPTLYKVLSHSNLDKELIEDVITLDESTKRYSFGPPIESMQQLLALVDADVVTLDVVNDPEIDAVVDGWKFTNDDNQSVTATIIINSLIDPPKLERVNSSIIENLLDDDLIDPIHTKLGVETSKDGCVTFKDEEHELPIAILGRLAQGSVIGVDAILECFGTRIEHWAIEFVKRLN